MCKRLSPSQIGLTFCSRGEYSFRVHPKNWQRIKLCARNISVTASCCAKKIFKRWMKNVAHVMGSIDELVKCCTLNVVMTCWD